MRSSECPESLASPALMTPPLPLPLPDAQLPEAQRQGIPHHLIDVRDPGEDFSAGDFHDLAREAAHDIVKVPVVITDSLQQPPWCSTVRTVAAYTPTAAITSSCLGVQALTNHLPPTHVLPLPPQRGKVPIVVGGTGFYLRWFTHGKAQGPKTTPQAIAHVQQALKQVGV